VQGESCSTFFIIHALKENIHFCEAIIAKVSFLWKRYCLFSRMYWNFWKKFNDWELNSLKVW